MWINECAVEASSSQETWDRQLDDQGEPGSQAVRTSSVTWVKWKRVKVRTEILWCHYWQTKALLHTPVHIPVSSHVSLFTNQHIWVLYKPIEILWRIGVIVWHMISASII